MDEFTVSLDDLDFVGQGLRRPECVLCTRNGAVFFADGRGGVSRIAADGTQQSFLAAGREILPNGIALQADGTFLIANLGDEGGLFRLRRDGALEDLVRSVDGVDLPPCNYVTTDDAGRIWLTVSTRKVPRALAYRPDAADGFIVLIDGGGARIVADGLGYTNEVGLDGTGGWLYVNETFGRRLSRFKVAADGSLSGKETVTSFGHGTFPDGLTLDAEGGVWITAVVSNRVIRVAPDGSQHLVVEDFDGEFVDAAERAYAAGEMGRVHLDTVKSRKLRNVSSLAFGGEDLRTVYLGCLLGDRLATFRSPVAGLPPVHWTWDI